MQAESLPLASCGPVHSTRYTGVLKQGLALDNFIASLPEMASWQRQTDHCPPWPTLERRLPFFPPACVEADHSGPSVLSHFQPELNVFAQSGTRFSGSCSAGRGKCYTPSHRPLHQLVQRTGPSRFVPPPGELGAEVNMDFAGAFVPYASRKFSCLCLKVSLRFPLAAYLIAALRSVAMSD